VTFCIERLTRGDPDTPTTFQEHRLTAFEISSYDKMVAVTVFVLVLIALLLLKAFIARQLKRLTMKGHLELLSYPEQIVNATRLPFLMGVSLLAAVSQLQLMPRQEKMLQYAWIIILVSQIALWANRMISVAVKRAFERRRETDPAAATHLMLAGLIGRIVLWTVALLVTLDNLGFNITTLMASLGIGGVAVALAVQNILGDIFSSVSIALDKPFVVGDFIVVDSFMGTVEYVGMKTTRILSLSGEQIIFSNTELLKSRIRNYKRMQERRIQFEFGISYGTTFENIKRVPELVREAINAHQGEVRFDRAHFKGYGESALQFEVVYIVLTPDFNKYMDVQQAINLTLFEQFSKHGIAFAHPTRILHVAPTASREANDVSNSPRTRIAGV
jgi:small-conductance mechanosensitive channel